MNDLKILNKLTINKEFTLKEDYEGCLKEKLVNNILDYKISNFLFKNLNKENTVKKSYDREFIDIFINKKIYNTRLEKSINEDKDIILNEMNGRIAQKYNECYTEKIKFINKYTDRIDLNPKSYETKKLINKEIYKNLGSYLGITYMSIFLFFRVLKLNKNKIDLYYTSLVFAGAIGLYSIKYLKLNSIFNEIPELPLKVAQLEKEKIVNNCMIWDFSLLTQNYHYELLNSNDEIIKLLN